MEKFLTIKDWAKEDRPREKLQDKGVAALSDAELFAIILGTGSRDESALDLAKKILHNANNNLVELGSFSLADFIKIKGIGPAKAISMLAALEIGRRRNVSEAKKTTSITCSKDIYNLMQPKLGDLEHEEFWIICLNRSNVVISDKLISKGGITGTVVDVKLIAKFVIEQLASGLILCHNHPSGNIKPSQADIDITKKLIKSCEIIDCNVLDHVIITQKNYYSFADEGIFIKKCMKIQEAFNILEIDNNASISQVKFAYRQKVKLWHPDVNNTDNARETFEKIHKAYELILAYLEYKKIEPFIDKAIDYKRLEKIQQAQRQKKQQKDLKISKLNYAIHNFINSRTFIISKTISIVASIIAIFSFYDYFINFESTYTPIQGIYSSNNKSDINTALAENNLYIIVENQKIAIAAEYIPELIKSKYVKIEISKGFKTIKKIVVNEHEINFYNMYNDTILLLCFALLGSLLIFIIQKSTIFYYFMVKFYNVYFIPLLIFYIIMGNVRIVRLFEII